MSLSVATWLLNFGVAGVVIVLLATGVLVPGMIYRELVSANDRLSRALEVERQRNSDLQQLAATSVKAMNAVADVARENRKDRQRRADTPPHGISVGTGA